MRSETLSSALAAITAASGLTSLSVHAGELDRIVLRNGLEVILARKSGVPLVTVEIAIRAGAFIETPELDGLTHLHEHMFFKANRAIPDQAAYLRRLEELGMYWNGSTSHEVVRYYFTLPSDLLREGMEFTRDAIQSPLFVAEELDKERKVVLSEYDRNEANPLFHLRRAVEQAMFSKYYSRKNVIGNREVIGTATREKLQFIQDEFYVPNNAALIIAGDFDPANARRLADELFGAWPRRPDPFARNPVPEHPPMDRDDFRLVEKDVRTATILFGWHGPSVDKARRDAVAADVLSTAINHPTSRFYRALVDSGLATRISFGYYTLKHVGELHLSIETTPEKVIRALAAARKELNALAQPGYFSAEEVARAGRELITQDAYDREKPRDFALSLAFWWSVGGVDSYLSYAREVAEVSSPELTRLAARYLPGEPAPGASQSSATPNSAPPSGVRTAAAVLVSPAAREANSLTTEALARAFAGEGEALPSAALEPVSNVLPNGTQVITRQVPGSQVGAFGLYFRGLTARSRQEEAGLEQLLLQTITDRLERSQADELARLGARVRFAVNADYSTLGIQCLRGNLEAASRLLTGALRQGAPAADDVERNRAKMIAAYQKALENPDQAVQYVADRTFLPAGHPYLAYPGGTDESLRRITLPDLEKRRQILLTGRRILAVVVSDLDAPAARALVERTAGDLPAAEAGAPAGEPANAGAAVNSTPPPIGGAPARLTVEERAIPTCYIVGKFAAPGPGEPEYEALSVALSILHRKMFLEVRTKRALTYAVLSGAGERDRNFGYLYVTSQSPTQALQTMYATLDSVLSQPLTAEDLRASVLTYTTRQLLRQESVGEQADWLAREELVGGDHRRALDLKARLEKLEVADIQRALEKHVRALHYGVIGSAELVGKMDRAVFTAR